MSLVFSKALDDLNISIIRQMNQKKKPDTVDLGLGQLLLPSPQILRQAGADSFSSGSLGYSPTAGLPELREAIAENYNLDQSTNFNADNVVVTNGGEHALYCLAQALINPGDEILMPEISYPAYPGIAKLFGAKIVEYKLTDSFNIDSEDLSNKLSDKTKIIIINSPSNPAGAVSSPEELKRIAKLVSDQNSDIVILSDEVYSQLNYIRNKIESISKYYDNTSIISSISKQAAGAGVRIGWVIAPEEIINQVNKIVQYSVTSAAVPNQKAVLAYLNSPSNGRTILDTLATNRALVIEKFSGTSLQTAEPKGAFYYFADTSKHGKSQEVADALLKDKNVLVIPGIAFGKAGDKYIRISFGVKTEILEQGILKIVEALG